MQLRSITATLSTVGHPFRGACLSIVVAAALAAQDGSTPGPQQPTFRTGIQSVRVDVYATSDGQPVNDLRREDIRLLEDGTPQTIQTFERISFARSSAILPDEPRTLEESRRFAADPHNRLFVLFLPTMDEGFALGPNGEPRRLLVEPLNSLLGPDDLIAVMTPYTRIADLTFHRRVALNSTRLFPADDYVDPKHQLWDLCYPPQVLGSLNAEMRARYFELRTFEALDALVDHLGGLREERKHIFVVTDGFRLFTENPKLAASIPPRPPGFPVGRGPDGLGTIPRRGGNVIEMTHDIERECEQDLNTLAALDHRNRLRELADRANRNNVSFTPVSLARLQTQTSGGGAVGRSGVVNGTPLDMQMSLRGLADDTDGMAIVNTNNIQPLLRQMLTATSAYYLLGYTSTNSALDGKFRRISVRVDRPGLRVHARSGYVAPLPPVESRVEPRTAPTPPNPVADAVRAAAVSVASTPLRVRASTWIRADSSGRPVGTIWIVGQVDARQNPRGASGAGAAQIIVQPPSGSVTTKRVDVPNGASSFDVVIDEQPGAGDYAVRVSVTRPDEEPLREIVGVKLAGEPTTLSEPIVSRRGPAAPQRFVRTADVRFQRNERLLLEVATNSATPASATLRDSAGTALSVPVVLGERAGDTGSWRWITAEIALAPLAPAIYAIEVRQGSTTRIAAFRVAP